MAYLLDVEDGDDLVISEVDSDQESGDLVLASPDEPGEAAERARLMLDQALNKLKPTLQKVVHSLKEMSPDETTIEFGPEDGRQNRLYPRPGYGRGELHGTHVSDIEVAR